jgi:hypothetical protein
MKVERKEAVQGDENNLKCSHAKSEVGSLVRFLMLWPSTQQSFQNKPNWLFTLVLFNNCYKNFKQGTETMSSP